MSATTSLGKKRGAVAGIEMGNILTLSSSSSNDDGGRNRIATERIQDYSSVDVNDESENSHDIIMMNNDTDDSAGSETANDCNGGGDANGTTASSNRRGAHRRRRPPRSSGSSNMFSSRGTCVALLGVLLSLAISVLLYQRSSSSKYMEAPASISSSSKINHHATASSSPAKGSNAVASSDSPIHYDLNLMTSAWNPFDLQGDTATTTTTSGSAAAVIASPLHFPWNGDNNNNNDSDDDDLDSGGAFFMQPDLVNHTLVFVSEGDLYLTRIVASSSGSSNDKQQPPSATPAMKLTTTIGNVRTPKLHPTLPLVAFTATYTGRREVYLQDWRQQPQGGPGGRVATTRLTYWDHPYGVSKVVGWKDEKTLLLAASSTAVSLPDVRLYQLTLAQEDLAAMMMSTKTTIQQQQQQPVVMEITPVPLAQALEGVYYHHHHGNGNGNDDDDNDDECLYFTRFQQSSHTIRYIGGTAENIWMHCSKKPIALPITANYNGTSKNPTLYIDKSNTNNNNSNDPYLLFLSDRSSSVTTSNNKAKWTPTTMNLWAMPLPSPKDAYVYQNTAILPIPLTSISCQFHGRSLQEFTVDPVTRNVILRIGADLYQLTAAQIHSVLSSTTTTLSSLPKPTKLDIAVYSDFHELQERIIPVNIISHLTNVDVFETPVVIQSSTDKHAVAALFTLRGQAWVAPVLAETKPSVKIPYQGAGQNLPQRRYRVAPGTFTAGAMRILNSLALPVLVNNEDDDDENSDDDSTTKNKRNKRWAILLATDPLSPTAEHAFYLVRVDTGAPNAFNDLEHLPEPFLGGHVNGGSTADGGLGSVWRDSLTISPCGRRMAWTDTDNRICVMTIPLYQSNNNKDRRQQQQDQYEHVQTYTYTVLPQENELGEPMFGHTETKLSWSPGGRYLAVNHMAGNQFLIISIVDCGDPAAPPTEQQQQDESTDNSNSTSTLLGQVAEIQIGRIVQATPSRFNSFEPYWGTTTADAEILEYRKLLAQLIPSDNGEDTLSTLPESTSTTIYFLTDRNIVSDVDNPFGSRTPLPHFPFESFVYALPLTPKAVSSGDDGSAATNDDGLQLPLGRFSGGGAMEVIQDELDALAKVLKQLLLAKEAALTAESSASGGDGSSRKRRLTKVSEKLARALIARGHNAKTGRRAAMRWLLDENDDDTATIGGGGNLEDTPAIISGDTPAVASTNNTNSSTAKSPFPVDMDIDFGPRDLTFARQAYRLPQIPKAKYSAMLSQTADDGSLVLVARTEDEGSVVKIFMADDYPGDSLEEIALPLSPFSLLSYGVSTNRKYIILILGPDGATKVIPNTITGLAGAKSDMTGGAPTANIADTSGLALSVWPALEYKQMFNDAWRMFRDYFYDTNLHAVDWPQMHKRYSSLVKRCTKREELDDVLVQLASELSALHVFVYGGEYSTPFVGDLKSQASHTPASLGVSLQRKAEWKGYMITEIPHRDPDFNIVEVQTVYSPLSEQALRPTGQKGLQVGDVIVGVNGESALRAPDIHMLLRGMAGQSVRLEVLRLASGKPKDVTNDTAMIPEPVVAVPLTQDDADNLRYAAWEWKTRLNAKELAKDAGFTVGYVHLRSMQRDDMDAFARGFFEDYDKQTFILDVRHNRGGNIDSWISTLLQRKAWNYFASRNNKSRFRTGDNDWNQHFAFRGHIVLLIDEKTSSDGEGISRSLSELGLCRLIGTRTWGGGIWLSSDNHLVDGGIATAPEIGTFNDKWGWGTGVEMTGVSPDIEVDNNPRTAYDGVDTQLERAITELKQWLQTEPIVEPKFPGPKPDMSLKGENCPAA